MTISNTSRTAGPFPGNGGTSRFPFAFKVFDRTDLLVATTVTATGVETVLILDADYTVALNSDQNSSPGGIITTTAPVPVGTTLAATSNIAIAQTMDLTNGGGFYPKVINDALDRIVIQIQQLAARVGLGALNVGAAASIASVLGFITNLAGSAGASLVGFVQAGVGAVLRTLQDELRDVVKISQFDTLQHAVDQAAASKKHLLLDQDVTLAALDLVDFSAASGLLVFGPGRIVGPAVAVQGQPNAYLKLWGALGTAVGYGSAIAEASTTFNVAQSFAADDLLLLSNFPTDPTDAYTEGAPDIFGDKPRTYANISTANKRQTRRKELLVVRSATSSSFTTATGTANTYNDTAGLQFQKIEALENVKFIGVTFENVHVNLRYARNVTFEACTWLSSMLVIQESYDTIVDSAHLDARNGDCRIDVYEGSRTGRISGISKNFNSPSDNGAIKLLGCMDFDVDVVVEGCEGNAVMGDTAFVENPSGYSDLPLTNCDFKVVARSCTGQAVALTCDPYAAKVSYCTVSITSADAGCQLKGTENIDVEANINFADGSGNSILLYGALNTNISGNQKGGIYYDIVSNPRDNTQTQVSSGTSKAGAWLRASKQPSFMAYLSAATTNSTGDGTEVPIAFDSEPFDKGGNQSLGVFTAPFEGTYGFNVTIKLNDVGAAHTGGWIRMQAGSTPLYYQPSFAALADTSGNCGLNWAPPLVELKAGDTVQVFLKVSGGTKTVGIQGGSSPETAWSGAQLN